MQRQESRILSISLVLPLLVATGCVDGYPPDDSDPATGEAVAAVTMSEGFEAGTKTGYAAADVTLGSGTWNLDDALIGTTASDIFTGTRSGRLRNSG